MKKFIMFLILQIVMINASCLKNSKIDKDNFINSNNVFNASDNLTFIPMYINNVYSITSKNANEKFYLKIYRKDFSTLNNKIYLVNIKDNKEENISDIKNYLPILSFETNDTYKNVKVKFEYDKKEFSYKNIDCPLSKNELENSFKLVNIISDNLNNGLYYIQENFKYKCYEVKTLKHYIEYSTDNFAIKPYKFNIKFNNIISGKLYNFKMYTLDKNNNVVNYNSDNVKYEMNIDNLKYKYNVNINNGRGILSLLVYSDKSTDANITLKEKYNEFAEVDKDDTDDECRLLKYTDKIKILTSSKYWSGAGTNEKENTPENNTIQVNIKQNVNKDLKYNKVNW